MKSGTTVLYTTFIASAQHANWPLAVSQGIIAQVRVLGGSIGIAASTAIMGITQRHELTGVISSSQLATLSSSAKILTSEQLHAVRQAYSDAFKEDLRVCAIIAGICFFVTLGAYRRNPLPIMEVRKQFIIKEQRRLKALKAKKALHI